MQVQSLLKKALTLDIQMICPLHGPVWRSNLVYIINKYDIWSKYEAEGNSVMIAYASIYGNTEMPHIILRMNCQSSVLRISPCMTSLRPTCLISFQRPSAAVT